MFNSFQALVFLFFVRVSLQQIAKCIVVVEYHPVNPRGLSVKEILERNTEKYLEILENVSKNNNIILIVFPESTLEYGGNRADQKRFATGRIIPQKQLPCTLQKEKYPEFFRKLSCAARNYSTILAANVIQKFDDDAYYSTDVVFYVDGSIMYSLRKEYRIGEDSLRHTPIAFEYPANSEHFWYTEAKDPRHDVDLYFKMTSAVTGFRFSHTKMIRPKHKNYAVASNWISQLPFLTSLQVYQMWGQEFGINLFFSGANNPETGQGGTGIYHSSAPVFMDIMAKGGTKAYVYNITDDETAGSLITSIEEKDTDTMAKEMDSFKLQVDPDLSRYKSKVLPLKTGHFKTELCYHKHQNHFCCAFTINLSINSSLVSVKRQYTYHMVAYKGHKSYYSIFEPGGVEVCGVIACLNGSLSSCGRRFKKYEDIGWPLTFEEITIKASFAVPHKERIYYSSQFPSSLLSSIRPINPKFTNWTKRTVFDNSTKAYYLERTFSLTEPQNRILTFAIFGRNFSLVDEPQQSRNRQTLVILSPLAAFISWYATLLF